MKMVFLYVMALAYIAAGIYHFVAPYLPYHMELIYASGVFEIALGLLLLPASTRVYAAWGVIALLIAIFPANIQMAVNFYQRKNLYLWVAILRLPLQFLLIWWAYIYTKQIPDEV